MNNSWKASTPMAVNNDDQKELLSGGMVALGVRLLTIIINYTLLLLISWGIGATGVGTFHLGIAIISITALIGNLGISTCIVRFVAALRKNESNTSLRKLYFRILKTTLPITLLLAMIIILFKDALSLKTFGDLNMSPAFMWIGITLPFLSVTLINVEFFRGQKRVFLSEFFRNAFFLVLVLVGLLLMGYKNINPIDTIALYLIGIVISALITTPILLYSFKNNSNDSTSVSFREFMQASLPMMITAFVQAINSRLPLILLGIYCSTEDVGIYSTAFRIALITDLSASSLKSIAMPKVAELFWTNKLVRLRTLMSKSALWILSTTVPISLLLFCFPKFILGFFGEGFMEGAFVLQMLAAAQLINAGSGLVGAFMNMVGDQAMFLRLVIIATLCNIGIILFFAASHGIIAAAIAAVVSASIWNIGGAVYIFKKYRIATFYLPQGLIAGVK